MMKKLMVLGMVMAAGLLTGCFPSASSGPSPWDGGRVALLGVDQKPIAALPGASVPFVVDGLEFSFSPSFSQVDFILKNTTDKTVSIVWDSSTLQLPSNVVSGVFHKGIKYVDREKSQKPSLVPPGATLSDLAAPVDRVIYLESIRDWYNRPMFTPVIGEKVVFNLAVSDGEKLKTYPFTFVFLK